MSNSGVIIGGAGGAGSGYNMTGGDGAAGVVPPWPRRALSTIWLPAGNGPIAY